MLLVSWWMVGMGGMVVPPLENNYVEVPMAIVQPMTKRFIRKPRPAKRVVHRVETLCCSVQPL